MADIYVGSVSHTAIVQWAAVTSYSIGDIRRQLAAPAIGSERAFRCTTAGISGAAEPTWVITVGATTADGAGALVWTEVTGVAAYAMSAAHARMANANAAGWSVAGDRFLVASDHAATSGSPVSLAFNGSATSPILVLSIDKAVLPTLTYLAGATEATTANGALSVSGYFHSEGLSFLGSTVNSTSSVINVGVGIVPGLISIANGNIQSRNISAGGHMLLGQPSQSGNDDLLIRLRNVVLKFGAVGQNMALRQARIHVQNLSIDATSSIPTTLFTFLGGAPCDALIEDSDLTISTGMTNLVSVAAAATSKVLLRDCKILATNIVTGTNPGPGGPKVILQNCDSADTNYRLSEHAYEGSLVHETVIVRTGGASDGTVPQSLKMSTSADVKYPFHELRSPDIYIWNDAVTGTKTITFHVVHDSQGAGSGANFQDDEIWLEAHFLGTTGFPRGTMTNDSKANILATAANQDASTETWTTTGLTTPVKQKVNVTVSPLEKGYFRCNIVMAKASKVCYVCHKYVVT